MFKEFYYCVECGKELVDDDWLEAGLCMDCYEEDLKRS